MYNSFGHSHNKLLFIKYYLKGSIVEKIKGNYTFPKKKVLLECENRTR